ncbi:MAG TPA: co-chaperone GroES [Vicinamibacteria bacterium]|nr:co-chaperone GroES [Vicinamibacteria bacterium]
MNVRPLHDRILVTRIDDAEEKSGGGIIIPDTAREKPQKGKVTAVGNGKILDDGTRVAPEIKKGDRVLFGKYAGTEIKIEGTEYLILREDDVLAVLSK